LFQFEAYKQQISICIEKNPFNLYPINCQLMKNISLLFVSLFFLIAGCRSSKPAAGIKSTGSTAAVTVTDNVPVQPDFSDPSTWLIGNFDPGRLLKAPYSAWYIKEFEEYQFNTEAINLLMDKNKAGISIKIVMGTWCPDSRREVPRFMKILDIWQFPLSELTFVGVNNAKLSPVVDFDKLDIKRVPTFIIYKNNIEAGRIIEIPATSLEQDMVNILSRNE
jgi:thiol-disulfide isomerase/thioredoxin